MRQFRVLMMVHRPFLARSDRDNLATRSTPRVAFYEAFCSEDGVFADKSAAGVLCLLYA